MAKEDIVHTKKHAKQQCELLFIIITQLAQDLWRKYSVYSNIITAMG